MSTHWAELDDNDIVLRVVVGKDTEDEAFQWVTNNLGGRWIRTSFTGKIRKNFATVGGTYSKELDAFIAPKPTEGNYVLDEETCKWIGVEDGSN